MKPYLVIVNDSHDEAKVLNIGIIHADNEQHAEQKAAGLFSRFPEEDICVYDVHELNHDNPNGWVYID